MCSDMRVGLFSQRVQTETARARLTAILRLIPIARIVYCGMTIVSQEKKINVYMNSRVIVFSLCYFLSILHPLSSRSLHLSLLRVSAVHFVQLFIRRRIDGTQPLKFQLCRSVWNRKWIAMENGERYSSCGRLKTFRLRFTSHNSFRSTARIVWVPN